jgi:hypothetical protein
VSGPLRYAYFRDSVVTRWNMSGVLGRPHPKIGQSAWTRRSRSLPRPQVPEDACTWWFQPWPWIDRLCLGHRNHHGSEREAQCDSPKPEVPADHRAPFPTTRSTSRSPSVVTGASSRINQRALTGNRNRRGTHGYSQPAVQPRLHQPAARAATSVPRARRRSPAFSVAAATRQSRRSGSRRGSYPYGAPRRSLPRSVPWRW